MDEFYSPQSMRHLVHNSLVENLRQKEKRSYDSSPDTSSTLPRTKKMSKRLSSGYGSSVDDDAVVGLYSDPVVEMRPNPEMHPVVEETPPRKKKLAASHSLEGIAEIKDKDSKRGSWSPMSRLAKMWWLGHHKGSDRHDKKHVHDESNSHVDEGLHSADDLSDFEEIEEDEDEEAGFRKRGKSKSKSRLHSEMLHHSLPNTQDFDLCDEFLSAQGHEHPYSIKMSHVRGSKGTTVSTPTHPTSTTAATGEEHDGSLPSSLVDANDNELQCQFYLRETKKKTTTDKQRTKKVKKSPLMSFFKKSKTQSESASPPCPQGKWFRHPLHDICDSHHNLPKPIMTLLDTLFQHGPFTSGIFRKPANEKKKREFLEYLDQSDDCCMDETPVIVVSSTLKEFLRQMPDCLLVSDLYSEWIETATIQDTEERLAKVKSLVSRLPGPHQCLLRHLVCVLQRIAAEAETHNQMTAYNLAVCIAPSLIWPASRGNGNSGGSSSLGGEAEGLEKLPLVVQHMIERCIDVFGEDVVALFGEPHVQATDDGGAAVGGVGGGGGGGARRGGKRDSSTDSDSMHSLLGLHDAHANLAHRDNSSIDSLGGSEIESSPRVLKSHLSPTNLSRDSGLYSSDNQLYEDSIAESESQKMVPVVTQARKQSITRSVSQFEEPTTQKEESGNALSRSYDEVLDGCGQNTLPVPPPRKNRPPPPAAAVGSSSSATNPTAVTKDGSESSSSSSSVIVARPNIAINKALMRPCASASSMADMRRHKYYGQKRMSNDSLGSVEEYPSDHVASSSTLHPTREEFQHLQARHGGDIGTLHKSESGARLYINENDLGNVRYLEPNEGNVAPRGSSPGKQLTHHASLCREKTSATLPQVRRSWTEDRDSVTSTSTSSSSSSRPQPPSSLAANQPTAITTFTLSDSADEEATKDAVDSSSREKKASQPKQPEAIAVIQVPKGAMTFHPSQPSQRSEPVQRRRAGMTEKGSDIFPAQIRRSLCNPDIAPSAFRPPPQRDAIAEMPRSAQLVRALDLEPAKQPMQQKQQQWRPNQPPTYQEALRRKCQLNITEKDARDEKLKQERARKLYEQSVQLYSQQQEDSRPSQPPSYEQAVQRAEQIKKQNSPTKEAKKVARVRRHGHRSSDTKLDTTRGSSVQKVTRSKSDSSEHIHKLAKLQVSTESTDSEDEWPAVAAQQRRLRLSKSVERVPSKDKLSEAKKIVPRKAENVKGGYDSGSDSTVETTKRKQRTRIQSLRNRDWHKELSEAYSQVFYQPPDNSEPKYAYVRPTPKEPEVKIDRQRRRSWVPPVHPTKDLVQVDFAKDYSLHGTPPPAKNPRSSSHPNMPSNGNANPGIVLATRSQPVSPVKQAIVKPVKQTVPLKVNSKPVSSDSGKSTGKSSNNDSDSEGGFKEHGLGWSVAKLRNLYAAGESKSADKADNHTTHFYTGPDSQPPPRPRNTRPVREKTNPNAEEAYL